ncbi:hypothetical protein [Streptomyces coeruleorubidus]|uniref:Uncharacterized protein n=1 Tax=Streptomyces coeruleorubidus TaxID=116188 RepID=A0ABZ0KMK5_STRC4|nr:hypothetical protein [Streptomyces coeruleorubidus]WOT39049.1 hypothetical protein R5U08_35010 [Streptomyces coeruleorubidus]
MVDPSQEPDARDKTDEASVSGPSGGVSRWVKVSGLVALVVVLLVVVMLLIPGNHGPGRHFGGQAPLVGVTAATGPAAGGTG